jgi:hypothetical protein
MIWGKVFLSIILLLLLIGPGLTQAQITIDFVERAVEVMIVYPGQGDMRETAVSYEFGDFDEEINLTWFSTTGRARNTTSAFHNATSVSISGSHHAAIEFDGDLTPAWALAWTRSMVFFSIATAGTFEFIANLEGMGTIFQVMDEDNEEPIFGQDLVPGESIITGFLPNPGTYTVEVISSRWVNELIPSTTTLQFSLMVESGGGVGVTHSAWGTVKALFR